MTLCNLFASSGIVVPCDSAIFLAMLAVHIPFGIIAVIAGLVAMLSRKQPGRHPMFGTIYYWSLSVIFVTASLMVVLQPEFYHLFILGALSFVSATFGRMARRRRWQGWIRLHISGMGLSYILMLTAFYVDNGKNLPLWQSLPSITYWILPTAVGFPFIVNALLHHPLVTRAQKESDSDGE